MFTYLIFKRIANHPAVDVDVDRGTLSASSRYPRLAQLRAQIGIALNGVDIGEGRRGVNARIISVRVFGSGSRVPSLLCFARLVPYNGRSNPLRHAMAFLRFLTKLFLLPGTIVLSALNIDVKDDGGVFRSLINMIFWGFIVVIAALPFAITR